MPFDLRTQQYPGPKWIVWYADGSRVTETDCDLDSLQKRGVIAITQRSPHGWEILRREDYYIWDYENHCWMGHTVDAMWFYLAEPGHKIVLFGKYIPDPDYWAQMTKVERFTQGKED